MLFRHVSLSLANRRKTITIWTIYMTSPYMYNYILSQFHHFTPIKTEDVSLLCEPIKPHNLFISRTRYSFTTWRSDVSILHATHQRHITYLYSRCCDSFTTWRSDVSILHATHQRHTTYLYSRSCDSFTTCRSDVSILHATHQRHITYLYSRSCDSFSTCRSDVIFYMRPKSNSHNL
jgi:hypothetical protein